MEFTTPLRKNYEFKRLYNRGESAASHLIVVYYRKNGTEFNRLGVTVSAKIGGAVQRNRVRRRLKEIYRLNEKTIKTGNDIVIVARMKSVNANYNELEASAMNLFRKLKLL
jgi:ribonuclease P protein component